MAYTKATKKGRKAEFEEFCPPPERRLPEMRWLKNKAFFGSVKPKALQPFK